jgi:hypothetical protein
MKRIQTMYGYHDELKNRHNVPNPRINVGNIDGRKNDYVMEKEEFEFEWKDWKLLQRMTLESSFHNL